MILFSTCMLAVQLAQKPCSPPADTRKQVLSALAECTTRPYGLRCSENVAEEVIAWYRCGDATVLDPLLDASVHSDAALAETLGTFLGQRLMQEPETLLRCVSKRSSSQQKALGFLAVSGDGSGFPPAQMKQIQHHLEGLAKNRNKALARVAKLWLRELTSFESTSQP